MPNSYERRRRQQRCLRSLKEEARRDLRSASDELGVPISANDEAKITRLLVALADPNALDGLDAPLPAHRFDLRREFCRRILEGRIRTAGDVKDHARELAPIPTDPAVPGRSFGSLFSSVTYAEAADAFASRRREIDSRKMRRTPTNTRPS